VIDLREPHVAFQVVNEMIQLRAPYTAPILRRSATLVRTGAAPDVWVTVTTSASRADPETKADLKVGDVVRFTAQYGIREKEDDSNLVVIRGTIVSPRNPLLPDSYGVRADEIAKTWKLDPTVTTPYVGQVFLVAPWSISAVETTVPAAPPPKTTESFTAEAPPVPEPSPDAKVVKPGELTGTTPQTSTAPPPDSSSSNVVLYAGLGVVLLFGLGAWWMAA